ncbi:MAG: ABC transporter permease, partial [candidate division Zixibacteria bacterium]|nr:ABC transporter permease [candidate division Zixibacteria bacterium]
FKDCPKNSHIKFDFLLPWENMAAKMGPEYTEAWGHTGVYTYLIMEPGTDPIAFEKSLQPMINAECPWLAEYNMTIDLRMQPLTDIHLNSHFMQEYEPNGDRESVDILALIALFIMIMAWVNFVNLATACSVSRAREVGMRKVVGATRRQIVVQHFFEFGVTNLIAASCAVILVALFQPVFNSLTGMPDNIGLFSRAWFVGALGVMVFVGVFLSGLYPVLAMASFKPASVLKGKWGNSSVGIRLRKALVVFQFAVGLVLVMATITVFGQVSFMRSQTLGFNMDQTMVIKAPRVRNKESYGTDIETLKETLMSFPEINRVCHVTEVPGRQIYWDAGGIHKAGEDISQSKNYQIVGIDYDFADAFELEFAAGRNFSVEFPTDKEALILNETAVQWMGFEGADSAVGQQVEYWGEIYTIVGVLKDYHQQSLKVDVEPHIFRLMPYGRGTMGMIAVKTNVQDVQATIASVRGQYDKMFPGNPFEYFFLDDYYHQQYESDERFGRVYSLFSLLAIVIIVLGIYGLSAFSITRMTKAIGIRKVLGASVSSITGMLTREFVILGAIANIVAWPVAYYSLSRWLENFAYRTEIGLGVFLLAGFTVMVVALGTVSMQVIRAARTNPVDAIREE